LRIAKRQCELAGSSLRKRFQGDVQGVVRIVSSR
jgi:hypothetical protein